MSTTKNKYFLLLLAFAMIAGACGGGSAETVTLREPGQLPGDPLILRRNLSGRSSCST